MRLIRTAAAKLSMATHTPVPYWLSLSLVELFAWCETVAEIQQAEKERG